MEARETHEGAVNHGNVTQWSICASTPVSICCAQRNHMKTHGAAQVCCFFLLFTKLDFTLIFHSLFVGRDASAQHSQRINKQMGK